MCDIMENGVDGYNHVLCVLNWYWVFYSIGVRHRENMRFARTKLFGLFRSLFRAIGVNMVELGLLSKRLVSR